MDSLLVVFLLLMLFPVAGAGLKRLFIVCIVLGYWLCPESEASDYKSSG